MNELTFEKLPQAVSRLLEEVNNIKRLLTEKGENEKPSGDQLLTIKEAAVLLHLSVPTCYGLVHRKEVPVCKKGKRLYFSKDELTAWVMAGRKKTVKELTTEAEQTFKSQRK
jgi:excisionase family DNA binding protein